VRTGRIKWFNMYQNHGYIVLGDGTEVYFHSSGVSDHALTNQLDPGTDVCFDLIETRAGMEAHNVEIIG
jgi:cold shock CspA family protein